MQNLVRPVSALPHFQTRQASLLFVEYGDRRSQPVARREQSYRRIQTPSNKYNLAGPRGEKTRNALLIDVGLGPLVAALARAARHAHGCIVFEHELGRFDLCAASSRFLGDPLLRGVEDNCIKLTG